MADPGTPNTTTSSRKGWIAGLAVALLLLAAAAAWWWWKGRGDGGAEARQVQLTAALDRNKALRAELEAIKPPDPEDCPPGEIRQPIPGAAGAPGAGASAVPPAPAASALPATGSAPPMSDRALAQHLERATAMVIVPDGNQVGTGTGFFIAPNLFVTNRHVVEHAKQQVLLVSEALKSVRRATVLRTTSSSTVGSPDFALLRLDEGTAPGTLDAADEVGKLSGVVAAGFPGVVVENDARFRRLLNGDPAAAPDLNLTQGTVQSLQSGAGGMPMIVHTASIAKGNSGGPLVDTCGRVVGVNTFISVDASQSAKINYAIRAQAMQAFLQSAGTGARADGRPCSRG